MFNPQKLFRKKALYFIFGPLSVFTLYLVVGFDFHIKNILEAQLSRLHGSDVTLGKLHVSPITGKFSFEAIQFAHPSFPSKNLFELSRVTGHVLIRPLLRRKLIIDHIEVDGIRYLTNRDAPYVAPSETETDMRGLPLFERFSTSAYGGLKSSFDKNPIRSLAQLSTGLHTQSLIEEMESELLSTKSMRTAENELTGFEREIEKATSLIANPKYISSMREKLKFNPENTDVAKKEIRRKLAEADAAKSAIATKMRILHTTLDNLDSEMDRDVLSVQKKLGLPDEENSELTPILFGPRVLYYLERLSYWIDLSRRKMPVRSGPIGKSYVLQAKDRGQNVHFPYLAGYPNFLVREISVTSKAESGTGTGEISGSIEGLTSDPYIYGKPLKATLALSFPDFRLNDFNLDLEIDHTSDKPKETLSLRVAELPLENILVSEGSELHLSFNKGFAKLNTKAEFNESHLAIDWDLLADNVEFKVVSRYKRVEDFVKSLVSTSFQLDLNGKIEGPVEELEMTAKSDFGTHLGAGLKGEFQHQLSVIHQTIKHTLQNMLHPRKHSILERIETHKIHEIARLNEYTGQLKELESVMSRAPSSLMSVKEGSASKSRHKSSP